MKLLFFILLVFTTTLSVIAQNNLKKGTWRGVFELTTNETQTILPFNFNVIYKNNTPVIEIKNAEERIIVNEITRVNDSVFIRLPLFDSEFKLKRQHADTLVGVWINYNKTQKNKIPFKAYFNQSTRFITKQPPTVDFTGRYEVTFNPKKEDEYKAVGVFKQKGNVVTGTFLTETGDYRYLEGNVQNNTMSLSCFDGSHAFLFFATSQKNKGKADSLSGQFFAGISGTEEWVAQRNNSFQLKDPESITYLKQATDKIDFSFLNLDKKQVSLNDERFKNKVVIVQIMGTWCPNCMDETAYLSNLYKRYAKKGVEIIALAYEKTTDFDKAKNNLLRLKKRFGVDYELLITELSGKTNAAKSLPFLNDISAFPTTLVLDKHHNVKSIYTGFSGPATGKEYEKYTSKTERLINQLLLEK